MNISNIPVPPRQHFMSSPNYRGTLNILWSSLFTILACTWTIQHLNLPQQRTSYKPGWMGTLKWYMGKFYTNSQWMLVTIIAPEIVIGMACYDLLSAKMILQNLQPFALEDDVPWTLTHSYFANMGGFVIQSGVRKLSKATKADLRLDSRPRTGLSDQSRQGNGLGPGNQRRNDIAKKAPGDTNNISYCNPYHLSGRQIWQLRKECILPKLPNITETELLDRSKSDGFVKVLALFQILWATTQIIVRAARKLAISQLELAVIAFAACAIIMYGLYWFKLKNVGATTTIIQFEGPIPQSILNLIKGQHTYMGYFLIGDDSTKIRHGSPIRNDATENYLDEDASFWMYPTIMCGATLFGGIHVGAWNFQFPSHVDSILWRVASVYTAACGPVIILTGLIVGFFENFGGRRIVFVQILVFLYIIARLVLLVEIFRTLFFLPPLAYVTTWTKDIPNFS